MTIQKPTLDLSLKQRLHQACQQHLQERFDREMEQNESLQKDAELETKSSVGDKYETGRAMLHLEQEKLALQIQETARLKSILDRLSFQESHDSVRPGSLVVTDQGAFFVSIPIGQIDLEGDALDLHYSRISFGKRDARTQGRCVIFFSKQVLCDSRFDLRR